MGIVPSLVRVKAIFSSAKDVSEAVFGDSDIKIAEKLYRILEPSAIEDSLFMFDLWLALKYEGSVIVRKMSETKMRQLERSGMLTPELVFKALSAPAKKKKSESA